MTNKFFLSVSALTVLATTSIGAQCALADTVETVQTTSPMSSMETTRTTVTDTSPIIRETPVIVTPPANNETVIVKEKKQHHHLLNVGVPLLFHTSIF
ncbi:MAG: hypothetical protein P4L53_06650 [Candidatus Obscuribacterales bacterium]|nr:hypothetical protein [Candidatus Obscuribacterales bacterium]